MVCTSICSHIYQHQAPNCLQLRLENKPFPFMHIRGGKSEQTNRDRERERARKNGNKMKIVHINFHPARDTIKMYEKFFSFVIYCTWMCEVQNHPKRCVFFQELFIPRCSYNRENISIALESSIPIVMEHRSTVCTFSSSIV